MTRAATQFQPAAFGSDRTGDASAPKTDSSALIRQLNPQDWRTLPSRYETMAQHKDITITDIEKDKKVVVDKSASEEARANAALELYESGIKQFSYKDAAGKEHVFKLTPETKDGKNTLALDDGAGFRTSFEYVQDEEGFWHVVPKESAPNVAGPRGDVGAVHRAVTSGGGNARGGGGGGGGGGERVPSSRPRGMSYSGGDAGGVGHYSQPGGSSSYNPAGAYDHHVWQGVKNTDGSVAIKFSGCQVDTDGAGAHRHPEDATRQSQTSLRLSNGQSLDTDRDNFFVLPPSVAKAYGIHKGDLGWLVQEKTGKAVPVVFGDAGPEGKLGEASVHALQSLGFNVNGRSGVDRSEQFKVVFVPGSGDGTGDIASDANAMAAKLAATGKSSTATQIS